ncbi:MAG: hypothetical protein IKU43_07220 [Clostridia bacterium]|nr:hypothetical protein [Clostridia bacterium]
MDNTVYCVLSHTHWDREWYRPFEQFRMRLCDLINNLFAILEQYPDYIFHLDAQTVVLEDYLEVYPENEEKLKGYIKSGNIIVGPWYVQNDFYLSSGEATVRNLLIGMKTAEKFGKCATVGYTPDQFGLCSQLPQIFGGFGIKYHLFGRGYSLFEKTEKGAVGAKKNINFIWQSPDGSSVVSTLMPFWYNNAQRLSPDIDKTLWRLGNMKKLFSERTESPFLILMNGVDHLEAQDDLLPIIDELNKRLQGEKIRQFVMEDALKANEPYAAETVTGELRYGREGEILSGTLSTRTDIKKLNFDAQNLLEHKVEPLYAMISLMGADIYPSNMIDLMWKKLIPNHAHDSICCCSNSNVMKHMQDRYLSINEIGKELLLRGGRFINNHIKRDTHGDGVYYLTAINTSQMPYTGVMECELDINISDADKDFRIFSPDGKEAEFVILNKEKAVFSTFSPLNLPGSVDVVNYKIQLFVKDIPAFGYVNYTVKTGFDYTARNSDKVLENDCIRVDFDGETVNLLDKSNDRYYRNILSFEDIGDNGDAYVFEPFKDDKPVKAVLENVEILYCNPLKSAVRLSYRMDVPESKSEEARAGKTVTNRLEAVLSLGKDERALSVDIKLENNSTYHLTRAVINTEVDNTATYASSVYDVIKRDSRDVDLDIRTCYSQPNSGFVYKKCDSHGVAVFTKGLYEYENRSNKLIGLSLLRSTDMILAGVIDPKAWGVKDNLMTGTYNLSFAILPFDGNAGQIPAMEQSINSQPLYHFDSTDIYMFAGGRPVVQDSDVGELYFPKDKYESLELEHSAGLISVNDGVCVTALKKAVKTDDIILRMYNPSDSSVDNVVSFDGGRISKTNLAEAEEAEFDNCIGKKEIETLKITSAD